MNIKIYRGTKEIGGSCVELSLDGWRLILDIGQPLVNKDGNEFDSRELKESTEELIKRKILPDIQHLYNNSIPDTKTAVIISHSHMDHYGLANHVHSDIPIYASQGTREIIQLSSKFLPDAKKAPVLLNLNHNEILKLGPFSIKPYLVDHSAPDSQALLIEGGGKRILYSGDLRGHGRKGYLFEQMVSTPPKDIDYLLLEGTMLGRKNTAYPNEQAVEDELYNMLKQGNPFIFFFCSSQNIDRLVSAYKAAKKSDSIFVIDIYTAYVLHQLRCISKSLPQHNWPNIKVKFWHHHEETLKKAGENEFLKELESSKITADSLVSLKGKRSIIFKSNSIFDKIANLMTHMNEVKIVWSMWSGYLEKDQKMKRFESKTGLTPKKIHTSGHATVEDLKRLAEAIKPKYVVPIHTFNRDMYNEVYDSILYMDDNEALHCD